MSILLITRSDDNASVDMVARALVARGEVPIRLDTDRYPEQLWLSTAYVGGRWERTLSTPTEPRVMVLALVRLSMIFLVMGMPFA